MTMDKDTKEIKEHRKEKPLNELLTSSIVDIYVGPEATHWPLHERLLCYYSPFFASIFYKDDKNPEKKRKGDKSYGLPDEDDFPFELLVGWLYSRSLRQPQTEKDVGPLLDLYLLSEKFEMQKLGHDIVETIRAWYHSSSTYPGLRRVQYIYAETDEDNEMREMMVSSIARQLTTSDTLPAHWVKALQRNGQLAVDIIRSIQQWNIEERSIPDVRDGSRGRNRLANGGGFSAIEPEPEAKESTETLDTNMTVEDINGTATNGISDKTEGEETPELQSEPPSPPEQPPQLPPRPPERRTEPPDKQEEFANPNREALMEKSPRSAWSEPEVVFLLVAWSSYFIYALSGYFRS